MSKKKQADHDPYPFPNDKLEAAILVVVVITMIGAASAMWHLYQASQV